MKKMLIQSLILVAHLWCFVMKGVKVQNDHEHGVVRNLHGEGNFGVTVKFLSKFKHNKN